MKYFGVLVLGTFLSQPLLAASYSDDFVTGSCSQVLGAKKISTSKYYGNHTDIDSLEKSNFSVSEFTINDMGTKRLGNQFRRVVPYPTDTVKHKDEHITVFQSDIQSITAIDADIPYSIVEIPGKVDIALRYSRTSGTPRVTVDVVGLKNGMNLENARHYTFRNGKAFARIELDVLFDYKDYSYRGFLGLPGWMSDEIEEDGNEVHRVTYVTECDFQLSEIVDTSDRDSEKEKSRWFDFNKKDKKEKEEKPAHVNPTSDYGTIYKGGEVVQE